LPDIEKDYIKTGKVKYVFLDFPLGFHNKAFKAAEAANCAGDQGKFWQMHDRLYANQNALSPEDLLKHADALGLEMSKFKECLDGGKYAEEIRKDTAKGQKAGISGTPAFLMGFSESEGKVKAVNMITGAQPYSAFKEAIEKLLSTGK
jgi:protein-disulfide isomerase